MPVRAPLSLLAALAASDFVHARATVAPEPLACKPESTWNTPASPWRIHGESWYVGTCGLTSILVRTREDDVLLDAGTEESAPLILANLRTLGVDPRGIRCLDETFTAQLRASIAAVSALPCALLLTPHPDASRLWERTDPHATLPLFDRDACRRYAECSTTLLEKRLAKERASTPEASD